MTSCSVLFTSAEESMTAETAEMPAFFVDLNLDQIVNIITAAKEEYNLKPYFYTSLKKVNAIMYRHEVMRDLEKKMLFEKVETFARKMREMRAHLLRAKKLSYKHQRESWFLDAVELYCGAVQSLSADLDQEADLESRGLSALRDYVRRYVQSDAFTSLMAETRRLKHDLAQVQYCLLINYGSISVRRHDSETDYRAEVEATFEKFKQAAARDYSVKFSSSEEMNHVEAQVLDCVAELYPDVFLHLGAYCDSRTGYLDETIAIFDREIQLYVSYLEFIAGLKHKGLDFCYPRITDSGKEVYDSDGFDLALAHTLSVEGFQVVCNDFHLMGNERIIVVSGPNQGGKTTFARAFGQLHYLASLGCPVPGRKAQLFLFDRLFTHFEKAETVQNGRGRLQGDLLRFHEILSAATFRSIIIMNEIFSSTTLRDAMFLGKRIMGRIMDLDVLCVCVTFIDELSCLSEKTVSMVSTIVPEDPALRTYKLVRKPADGLAYALSIAEKYRLTSERLGERLQR
jgi:DNA mismatch repair ATPase MutS